MKIMFVCHGNICRSPMAEIIFKDLLKKSGLDGVHFCASSATSDEEIGFDGVGNPVYPKARKTLLSHGLDPEEKRAVQLKRSDYEHYDLFVGMDAQNIRNMLRIFGSDPDGKVIRLNESDVFDPWYSGDFETAYNEIYEGVSRLFERLALRGENDEK